MPVRCSWRSPVLPGGQERSVPYRIRTEPSDESLMLDEIIASVSGQLDGLAGDDPAALPLCEHLDALTARRDLLLRAREDGAYAWNRQAIWLWMFLAAGGTAMAAGGLAGLVSPGRYPLSETVTLLACGALLMLVGFPLTFAARADIREYRRTHPDGRP
jgi:hypothetical protein